MISGFRDPFEALFAMQRALEAHLASDWMGGHTAGMGTYPPINVFQRGDGFVAVIELPGLDKNDIEIEAKENTIRISGRKMINYDQAASVHRRRAPRRGDDARAAEIGESKTPENRGELTSLSTAFDHEDPRSHRGFRVKAWLSQARNKASCLQHTVARVRSVTCELCHHEASLPANRWEDGVLV